MSDRELYEFGKKKLKQLLTYLSVIIAMVAVIFTYVYITECMPIKTSSETFEQELEEGKVYKAYFGFGKRHLYYFSTQKMNICKTEWGETEEHAELLSSKGVREVTAREKNNYLKDNLVYAINNALLIAMRIIFIGIVFYLLIIINDIFNIKSELWTR